MEDWFLRRSLKRKLLRKILGKDVQLLWNWNWCGRTDIAFFKNRHIWKNQNLSTEETNKSFIKNVQTTRERLLGMSYLVAKKFFLGSCCLNWKFSQKKGKKRRGDEMRSIRCCDHIYQLAAVVNICHRCTAFLLGKRGRGLERTGADVGRMTSLRWKLYSTMGGLQLSFGFLNCFFITLI